jgi:hypothetical protein
VHSVSYLYYLLNCVVFDGLFIQLTFKQRGYLNLNTILRLCGLRRDSKLDRLQDKPTLRPIYLPPNGRSHKITWEIRKHKTPRSSNEAYGGVLGVSPVSKCACQTQTFNLRTKH